MPPFEMIDNAWYARPEDEDYDTLQQRAESGEVDEWRIGDLHLFAHPQHYNGKLLGSYVVIERLISDDKDYQAPILVTDSETTRAWKAEQQAKRQAERQASLSEQLLDFEAVKQGKLFAYHIAEAPPIHLERSGGANRFRRSVLEDPLSAGLMYIHFDSSKSVNEVARKLKLGSYPSAIIPIDLSVIESAIAYETVITLHDNFEDWTNDEKADLKKAKAELSKKFKDDVESWRLVPKSNE
jgi:hypothetical protein